uniref:Venom protein n=1 Tax=Strongyloides stercoralis TaxID=6248 RepID=A0A0K0DSU7_STRER
MKIIFVANCFFIFTIFTFNSVMGGFMDEDRNNCDFTDCIKKCKSKRDEPGSSPFIQAYCVPIKRKNDPTYRSVFTADNKRCVCTTHPPPEFVDE